MSTKELKSLEEHNAGARKSHRHDPTCDDPWRACGLKCPKCGNELMEDKKTMLMSMPPQSNVRCDCGYHGFKVM